MFRKFVETPWTEHYLCNWKKNIYGVVDAKYDFTIRILIDFELFIIADVSHYDIMFDA